MELSNYNAPWDTWFIERFGAQMNFIGLSENSCNEYRVKLNLHKAQEGMLP